MEKKLREIKTVTLTKKRQICIPKTEGVSNFKEGDKIVILVYDDKIQLIPAKNLKIKKEAKNEK